MTAPSPDLVAALAAGPPGLPAPGTDRDVDALYNILCDVVHRSPDGLRLWVGATRSGPGLVDRWDKITHPPGELLIGVTYRLPEDVVDGSPMVGHSFTPYTGDVNDTRLVLDFAAWQVCRAVCHEALETLTWRGERVHSPHGEWGDPVVFMPAVVWSEKLRMSAFERQQLLAAIAESNPPPSLRGLIPPAPMPNRAARRGAQKSWGVR